MRKLITRLAILALVAAGLAPSRVRALDAANYTADGQPFTWGAITTDLPLTWDIDTGGLGKMKHADAEAMVNQAFAQWQKIDTASLFFHRVSGSDVLAFTGNFKHVTVANVDDFFNGGAPIEVTIPVLLDTDGSLTDFLAGAGASLDFIAFPQFLQYTPDGTLNQVAIVLNGRAVDGKPDPDDLSVTDLTRATMQVIGQVLDLSNSDVNDELIFDGNPANNTAIPILHFGTNVNGTDVPIIGGGMEPTLEDRMTVSAVYPSDKFNTSAGTIEGSVLLPDGVTGVQGIGVYAHLVGDEINSVVSAISGAKFQASGGFGSRDPKDRGAFVIHAPPGSYILEFRPLREPNGPRGEIFPLPGGRQFLAASGSTADRAAAMPVTVIAGAATTVNLIANGKPAPAPQTITAVQTPHDTTQTAQVLPLSATVNGHVTQSVTGTPGQIVFDYIDPDAGDDHRRQDKVEDLYRLEVPEASILTLRVTAASKVDLNLVLLDGFPGGPSTPLRASSQFGIVGNSLRPETLQVAVAAGPYFIGVSAFDVAVNADGTPKTKPQSTDYTLEVNTSPLGDLPNPTRPILDQFVLGNLTDKSADVNWVTDVDAASDVLAGPVSQEVGDPNPTKTHHLSVSGLTPGAIADLTTVSQDANAHRDSIPKVYFRSADTAAGTGATTLQAAVMGAVEDFAGGGVQDLDTFLVEVAIRNTGAPATNVQLTSLTASPGWKLVTPLAQPLTIGSIGTNGTAIVVVRLLRDGTGPAPIATVTGGGTLAGAGGAAANFTIGP